MREVWDAISAELETDASLLALLGTQTNASILAEREARATTVAPFLEICYDGSHALNPYISDQVWTVYCHHKQNAYVAGQILKKVEDKLHKQTITVSSESGVACMEMECFADPPNDFDPLFDNDIAGKRFLLHATRI
jgi:hypothetical protein